MQINEELIAKALPIYTLYSCPPSRCLAYSLLSRVRKVELIREFLLLFFFFFAS